MTEVSEGEIQTERMDHHGLVAAVCQDLKIAQGIDNRLSPDPQRKVSPGIAAVAMIINGLGFTNRTLYLSHRFFASKPVERLLGVDLKAEDINSHALGRALDDIAEYGVSKLFSEIAFEIALEHDLLDAVHRIDTTTLSVHGAYEVNDDPKTVEVTHGFSKDHRPDLKQVVLSLVVNGPSSIPLSMDPLNGNSSDKVSFHESIKNVERFRSQINLDLNSRWIADSALYTKERLLKKNDFLWVTRVPESIAEAKKLTEMPSEDIVWTEVGDGYKLSRFDSSYGGTMQRWVLVFSEKAYHREKKTLEKKIYEEAKKLQQSMWHFGNQIFHCEEDAIKAFKAASKGYKLHKIIPSCVPITKHAKAGRPKKGANHSLIGYRIETSFERDKDEIEKILNRKGRFILATNDLDADSYQDERVLRDYKDQQKVESGFRFLKDPWFMVDEIFLKLPKRIEALMMIMTLTLLVYNVGQYWLRKQLKMEKTTLPNQLRKEVQNPTLRWIFQMMEGISIVRFYDKALLEIVREVISNINELRKKIIYLFGVTAARIYGLIPKTCAEGLEM